MQEVGDAPAAIAAAPHVLELDLDVERSLSSPLEGRGVLARWDADERSMRIWSSTQTSTGVRAAVAAKLALPLAKVECITPDVGGGFGVKIVHPWPEEVLVPWAARGCSGTTWGGSRTAASTSSPARTSAASCSTCGSGSTTPGGILGLDVMLWHDNGAYTPYGIIVPIISSTQLLGPYKPGAYRVEFFSLYTNTVIVTPYRGAGRPQGVFAMERTMDAIAATLGLDRAARAGGELHPARRVPLRPRPDVPGRPAADLRLGRLPASCWARCKKLVGWEEFAA